MDPARAVVLEAPRDKVHAVGEQRGSERVTGVALVTHAVELERAVERVWRLLVIIEHEVPAHGGSFNRKINAQAPSRHVDLMRSLIAHVAVAVIPEPVPVVMEAVAREFVFGSGPGPEVVVEAGRDRLHRSVADRVPPVEA